MLPTSKQREIAESLLGVALTPDGFGPCPGAAFHTTGSGARDFRIFFEDGKMPREHCFHASCQSARDDFMKAFFSALYAEEKGQSGAPPKLPFVRPAPPKPRPEKYPFDAELAAKVAANAPGKWSLARLQEHSPKLIPADPQDWPHFLIDNLFAPGDRILIFTNQKSQGQFLLIAGDPSVYQLGAHPGQKARRVPALPDVSECGAWFLCAPVRGTWQPNPNNKDPRTGELLPGRRHRACCLRFPYAVLESDNLDVDSWCAILAQLREPIAAIYTSGGRSVHALVRVDARTHEEFNIARDRLLRLTSVGADPAAITSVRLTRLPGVFRGARTPDRLQRLVYLNPQASAYPIFQRPSFSHE